MYYDVETGFYYLNSRYYDPEIGRFLNSDTPEYLGNGSELNNYNLFSYCENNPISRTDVTGTASKLSIASLIIGGTLCFAAALTLLSGIGTATLTGAIAVGAAKGALLGAITGAIGGAAIGRIATQSWEGAFEYAAIFFGIGAIVGSILGGLRGAKTYEPPKSFIPRTPRKQSNIDPRSLKSQRDHLEPKKIIDNFVETLSKRGKISEPVKVSAQGKINDGHHRVLIAKIFQQTIDVEIV